MDVLSVSVGRLSIGSLGYCSLIFAGCAADANKRVEQPRSENAVPGAPTVREPAQKSVVSSAAALSASSLDALRQGKVAVDGPMKSIYFTFDSYALSSDSRAVLKANAAWLKANPGSMVEIEGHCDERGTTEYDLLWAPSGRARRWII